MPPSEFRIPETYLSKYLGFATQSDEPGKTHVKMTIQPKHLNIAGVLHGGLSMTLLDSLMGHAVFTHIGDFKARFATSSMTTHFIRSMALGEITGTGHVTSEMEDYFLASAELRDEHGDIFATAEGQFTYIRNKAKTNR